MKKRWDKRNVGQGRHISSFVAPTVVDWAVGTVTSNQHFSELLNKWLLLNANLAIFQLNHGENKYIFKEIMMIPA